VLERARYGNYGYPVYGANLKAEKLKLLKYSPRLRKHTLHTEKKK